ncbi:hypothetical protein, partial [Curtobacterium sp. MCBA15_013]|uniref:hypothetical protein n=1 Tax=Curtobacterium sp. MCBA15_013 TaxID=1898739 RepID=UPI001C313D06
MRELRRDVTDRGRHARHWSDVVHDVAPIHVDRRGSSLDDAVALYERVYDSRDIHIGDAARDG